MTGITLDCKSSFDKRRPKSTDPRGEPFRSLPRRGDQLGCCFVDRQDRGCDGRLDKNQLRCHEGMHEVIFFWRVNMRSSLSTIHPVPCRSEVYERAVTTVDQERARVVRCTGWKSVIDVGLTTGRPCGPDHLPRRVIVAHKGGTQDDLYPRDARRKKNPFYLRRMDLLTSCCV